MGSGSPHPTSSACCTKGSPFFVKSPLPTLWLLQILLSKGVQESKILMLTLIVAPEAVHRICRAFPRLKLITSEIDEGLENYRVIPGVGEFGDRYFCD